MEGLSPALLPKEIAAECAYSSWYFLMTFLIVYAIYVQFRVLRLRSSRFASKPTEGELFCYVVCQWICHHIYNTIALNILDNLVLIRHEDDVAVEYIALRNSSHNLMLFFGADSIPGLLARLIALSWVINLFLVFVLDEGIALFLSLNRGGPYESLVALYRRIVTRVNELILFRRQHHQYELYKLVTLQEWTNRLFTANCHGISGLQLRETKNRGRRTVFWKFIVPQVAVRGLADTLQRIGRFGELGFDISGNAVTFEASGVGCSVKIAFEMEDHMLARDTAEQPLN
jgi:hypothetical protein